MRGHENFVIGQVAQYALGWPDRFHLMEVFAMSGNEKELLDQELSKLDPAIRKQVEKAMSKGGKSRRASEDDILGKYPHVIAGTLAWDDKANKQFVLISCQYDGCDSQRKTFTSDLFQINTCDEHREAARKAKRELVKKLTSETMKKVKDAAKSQAQAPQTVDAEVVETE